MGSGRKPKPTHLKVLEGNRGKRDLLDHAPVPRAAFPDKPEFTSVVASDCWDRMVAELKAMHILHAADRDAIQVYSETYATWLLAQAMVTTQGMLIEGRDKNLVTNPAWRVARDAAGIVKSLGDAFGLTPAARSRIELPEVGGDSLEEILFTRPD